MNKISAQPPVLITQKPAQLGAKFKIILPVLAFLILVLIGFNLALERYGGFWEKIGLLVPGPTPTSAPTLGVKVVCPVPKEFCEQGKEVNEGEGFSGVAFTLPLGTPFLAAFPGQLSDEPKIPERSPSQPLLYLRNRQGDEAIYSFYGTTSIPLGTEISAKTEIGKIGEGKFPSIVSFGGTNFLFSLKKDGKFQKISSSDFLK